MHKKFLSILIGLFLVVSFSMAQSNNETAAEPVVYAYANYIKGKVIFGRDRAPVRLNVVIEEGEEIITMADGRIEILLTGGAIVRLDENTSLKFVVLNERLSMLRVLGKNVYIQKGELDIGVEYPGISLNLAQSQPKWYLTKPKEGFGRWNSKRDKEFNQGYLSESEYGYDYRSYGGYGYGRYGYYPYGGYGLRRYGRYYPYYYGRYGCYSSLAEFALFAGLSILFDRNYGYYPGRTHFYGQLPYYNYGQTPRAYRSNFQTVIRKNQLQAPRNTSRNTFNKQSAASSSRTSTMNRKTALKRPTIYPSRIPSNTVRRKSSTIRQSTTSREKRITQTSSSRYRSSKSRISSSKTRISSSKSRISSSRTRISSSKSRISSSRTRISSSRSTSASSKRISKSPSRPVPRSRPSQSSRSVKRVRKK